MQEEKGKKICCVPFLCKHESCLYRSSCISSKLTGKKITEIDLRQLAATMTALCNSVNFWARMLIVNISTVSTWCLKCILLMRTVCATSFNNLIT